jgi:hypothetical protein
MFDLIELFTHWHAGRSRRQLAQSLGIDRKTIAKYVAPAIAEHFTPGGDAITEAQWHAHIARWFPDMADPGLRATTWPAIAGHKAQITGWLGADVTIATIAQRLRDEHALDASESSVRRWITAHGDDAALERRVTISRGAVPPGAEAQIDYGKLGMWFDRPRDFKRSCGAVRLSYCPVSGTQTVRIFQYEERIAFPAQEDDDYSFCVRRA